MGMMVPFELYLKKAKGNLDLADKFARDATGIDCSGDEVRTKQEFKDDADINVIVARCVKDPNMLTSVYAPKVAPVYADVSNVGDFQTAMERVAGVEDAFMMLPPKVREFFGNDPWAVVPFIQDPKNLDKAVELGVVVRKPLAPVAPPKEEAVPAPKASEPSK